MTGRRTGLRRSVPVLVLAVGGARYLVAPYGEREWVRNACAAGAVELARAGRTERLRVERLAPAEAAPVLAAYWRAVRVTRPFFAVRPDGPAHEWLAEARRHPVLRLEPLPRSGRSE